MAESFMRNGVDPVAFCTDVLKALHFGRSPTAPLLALDILVDLWRRQCPVPDTSNFPLMDLSAGPKVAFLDEWRFENPSVSFA